MSTSIRCTKRLAKGVTMAINKNSTSTTMCMKGMRVTTNSRTGKVTTSMDLGNGMKLKNGKITFTF